MRLLVEKLGLRLSILFTFLALTVTAQNRKDYATVLAEANWGWQNRDGVEYGKASFADLYGNPQVVSIAKYSSAAMSTTLYDKEGSTQGTNSLATETGASVAINGSYFNMSTSTSTTALWLYGNEVATTASEEFARVNGIIGFKDGTFTIEPYSASTTSATLATWGKKYDCFVAAGPIIRRGGVSMDANIGGESFYGPHPRTMLGKCADGTVYMIVMEGRMNDATGFSMDNMVALAEDLGMTDAINLDGGGSSTLWINGAGVINRLSGGSVRNVPNIIIAVPDLHEYTHNNLQRVINEYRPKLPAVNAIGTDPGYYSASSVKAMSDAIAQAEALNKDAPLEQLNKAGKAIKDAYAALYCYPLNEGYYYIESVSSPGYVLWGDTENARSEGLKAVALTEAETPPYFRLTRKNGDWLIQCANDGMYVGTAVGANGNGKAVSLTKDAQHEQVITWAGSGQYKIQSNTSYPYTYAGGRVRTYNYSAGSNMEVRQMWHFHPAPSGKFSMEYNLENGRVRTFMHDIEYTQGDASKISAYNKNPPKRRDWPLPVEIHWTKDSTAVSQQIIWSENPDFWDSVTVDVPADAASYEIYNLIPGHTYYCKVTSNGSQIENDAQCSFTTTGQVRFLKAEGTANVRDLGGWPTACGRPIKYGMLFRGAEWNGGHELEPEGIEAMRLAGIKVELDLRYDSEAKNITKSVLGKGVIYKRTPLGQTASHMEGLTNSKNTYRTALQNVMYYIRNDKPVYFHCAIGRDRTGTLAFLLEGVLGMSKSDIYKEYELTNFSYFQTPCNKSQLDEMFAMIETLDGETLEDKFRTYLRTSLGITNKAIDEFREKMLGTDEEVDAINTIINEKMKSEKNIDAVYDLSGRKINSQFSILNSQLKKGIHIVNGQKIY